MFCNDELNGLLLSRVYVFEFRTLTIQWQNHNPSQGVCNYDNLTRSALFTAEAEGISERSSCFWIFDMPRHTTTACQGTRNHWYFRRHLTRVKILHELWLNRLIDLSAGPFGGIRRKKEGYTMLKNWWWSIWKEELPWLNQNRSITELEGCGLVAPGMRGASDCCKANACYAI